MKKRKISLRQLITYLTFALVILLGLTIGSVVLFSLLHASTNNNLYLILLIVIGGIFAVALAVFVFFYTRTLYKIFYTQLYTTSLRNLQKMIGQKNHLDRYSEDSNIFEFSSLNDLVDQIETRYNNVIVLNEHHTYNHIKFDYVEGYKDVVSYNSFIKYTSELVYTSEKFRNAFISFTFDLKGSAKINKEEMDNFVKMAHANLTEEGMIIADNSAKNEFIVYIPNVDSMSKLTEDVTNVLENVSVIRRLGDGANIVVCHASIVVYPYSRIEDIIADLRYANRQGKTLNLYLPNKKQTENDCFFENSMNLNNMSRLYEQFSAIDIEKNNSQKSKTKLQRVIITICQYFNFDQAGYATYNEFDDLIEADYAYAKEGEKALFSEGNPLEPQFVDLLNQLKDEDKSYYFSKRVMANPDLGRFLDKYGVESGHFYLIVDNDAPVGVIYFVRKKPLFLDTYLRESLLVSSHYIASLIRSITDKEEVDKTNKRFNDILKITGYNLYAIEKDTKKLTLVSEPLKELCPEAKVGQYCYKALYGRNKPCEKCPLATGKKMYELLSDHAFESSLALNVARSREAQILLSPSKEEVQVRDRFDKDLLINSNYSLVETLQNIFTLKGRGYMVLVSVDNYEELMDYYSNEELNLYIRRFTSDIRRLNPERNNIFVFNQNIFAIVLNESGKNDAIELIEKIYPLSQKNYMEDMTDIGLKLSYTIINYPAEYENATDLLKGIEKKIADYKDCLAKDMIIIPDSKYTRPASMQEYILSILDTAISEKSFSIKLQPIVTKRKKIIGAEILLRFTDNYRNIELSVPEVIRIAETTDRINLITDLLINMIGELYAEYGASLFKKYGFIKLAANTSYSFFSDKEFFDKIAEMREKYAIPDNFLTFEIPENEVYEHFEQFREIARQITKNNIVLYVDNYTGSMLPLDRFKEIGFTGVKIDRTVISEISHDPSKLYGIKSVLDQSNALDLDCTIVGVENMTQYNILKDDQHNFDFQGFYFHKPLDVADLLASIEKFNR